MTATRQGASVIGIGVAACAACCAGPLIGLLAAVGLGPVLGVAVLGVAGLAIALVAIVPLLRRRRRAATCIGEERVPVLLGRKPE
jgi:hypothetical protein